MKKLIFTCLALAAIASACTKSEVVDAPNIDTPISFEAYSGRIPVSKATSIDSGEEMETFKVWAFRESSTEDNPDYTNNIIMNGLTVKYSDGTWGYTSNKVSTIYWPNDGKPLYFVAMNELKENDTYEASTNTLTVNNKQYAANQKDLLVAVPVKEGNPNNATGDNTPDGKIDLKFYHMLSRVHFSVTTNREVNISRVEIINGETGFASMGTISLSTFDDDNYTESESNIPSITTTSTSTEDIIEQYSLFSSNQICNANHTSVNGSTETTVPIDATNDIDDDHYLMIFPCNSDDLTVVIDYKFSDETQTYTATASLGKNFQFEANKSYLFNLKLVAASIQFTVGVEPWDNDNSNTESSTQLSPTVVIKDTTTGGATE